MLRNTRSYLKDGVGSWEEQVKYVYWKNVTSGKTVYNYFQKERKKYFVSQVELKTKFCRLICRICNESVETAVYVQSECNRWGRVTMTPTESWDSKFRDILGFVNRPKLL